MKILAIGDVVGRVGRRAIETHLPTLKAQYKPDITILNSENAAGGFGLSAEIANDFFDLGVNVQTLGNHAWDQREMLTHINTDNRIVRALNFPEGTPGTGATVLKLANGKRILVAQVMARLFMEPLSCPFDAVDQLLKNYRLGSSIDGIVIDVHGEATSEKMALGHHLDGRVSLVFGTHTHIPTSDHHILVGGTAYQTDLGMTGDFDSVIGMQKKVSIRRFRTKLPGDRLTPAGGEATLCGCLVETDDGTGLAKTIQPIRIGGRLETHLP